MFSILFCSKNVEQLFIWSFTSSFEVRISFNEIIPMVNPRAGRLPGRISSQIIRQRPGSLGLSSCLVQQTQDSALQLGLDHLTCVKVLKNPFIKHSNPSFKSQIQFYQTRSYQTVS